MATRRQKQLQRKYASFRKYTAAEDVNYLTHSSRSSYRSESVTSRTSTRGRSSSTEIVAGSETRSFPVFIAIENYEPEPGDTEAISLEQSQIVEVLDSKNPSRWLVRTKARPAQIGFVPGTIFETPSNYYKQRRRTRELEGTNVHLSEEQEAVLKREQVYHDLLRTEEEFVTELKSALNLYVPLFDDQSAPQEVQDTKAQLVLNLREITNFHANILIPGLNYYSDDPSKVGQTFARLERDFEHHVHFFREWPQTVQMISEVPAIKDYLQSLSDKIQAGARAYVDYGNEVIQRISRYEEFFKEIIKYSIRAKCSTKSMQKGLELIQSIPRRADELTVINNIVAYPGDVSRLGRIYRHDKFQVWENDGTVQEREVFLFRNKLMITEIDNRTDPPTFKHCATIRMDKYTVRLHTTDDDSIVFKANEQGLPSFRIKSTDILSADVVRKAWMKDVMEMHEAICKFNSLIRNKYTKFIAN
ncbi:hypothetical protein M3Y98_00502600 [Aphelenchoides besseyi]|nr:hypothetical protein M3Y98_00502600 [Aphelenchoides besseyi]